MRAITQDVYGSAETLKLRDIDRPTPGKGRLLVRVHAAGVDRGVWHFMKGLPYIGRLGFGLRRPRTRVRGMAFAGQVVAVGEGVTGFQPGDEVFGSGDGSYAEYACARADKCAPKPANLSYEQAAAVPVSAVTALRCVRDAGRVRPGQRVLVIGAGGGVGTYAVQLAKALGAHVTGVCSTRKTDIVLSIGADEVIDYTRTDFADTGEADPYDVIIDIAGNRSISHLRRALAPKGTLVIAGGEKGGPWLGGIERNLRAMLLSPFLSQRLRAPIALENQKDLQHLKDLIEAGKVTPIIDRTYPLEKTPEAMQYLEDGHAKGKLVITL